MGEDAHFMKFRFNQQFRPVQAEEFLMAVLSDPTIQKSFGPLGSFGKCEKLTFKQL